MPENGTIVNGENEFVGFFLFHDINHSIVLLMSTVFNAILLWFLFKRSPPEIFMYARCLAICALADFLHGIVNYVTQMVAIIDVDTSVVALIPAGSAQMFGAWFSYNITIFNCTLLVFSSFVVPMTFVFRYMLLCRKYLMTQLQVYAMFSVVIVLVTIYTIGNYWVVTVKSKNGSPDIYKSISRLVDPNRIQYFCFCPLNNAMLMYVLMFVSIFMTLTYAMAVYMAMRIRSTLASLRQQMSQQTADLNDQMSRTLAVQLLFPLIAIIVPVSFFIGCIFFHFRVGALNIIMSLVLSWIPVINPLIPLLCINHYRKTMMCVACRGLPRPSQKSSIVSALTPKFLSLTRHT